MTTTEPAAAGPQPKTLQIKHRYTGAVLFECAAESGMTMRHVLERAVASGANLSRSDLSGSNLSGSDLRGSDLRGSNLSGSWKERLQRPQFLGFLAGQPAAT